MTKFLAAVPNPESLLARRARLQAENVEAARATESRQEPKSGSGQPVLDADMLEIVSKFEQNFAELAPARDETQLGSASDDLFPEFPEPFDSEPPRNRPRTLELARFEPPVSRDLRPELDEQVDIDEAFAILKAAEAKGAGTAKRAADDAQALAAERRLPPSDVEPEFQPQPPTPPSRSESERVDWAARSHTPRTIAITGGIVVLAIGLTLGYVAGRSTHGQAHATIATTQQGVPLLRLDYDLRKR